MLLVPKKSWDTHYTAPLPLRLAKGNISLMIAYEVNRTLGLPIRYGIDRLESQPKANSGKTPPRGRGLSLTLL